MGKTFIQRSRSANFDNAIAAATATFVFRQPLFDGDIIRGIHLRGTTYPSNPPTGVLNPIDLVASLSLALGQNNLVGVANPTIVGRGIMLLDGIYVPGQWSEMDPTAMAITGNYFWDHYIPLEVLVDQAHRFPAGYIQGPSVAQMVGSVTLFVEHPEE